MLVEAALLRQAVYGFELKWSESMLYEKLLADSCLRALSGGIEIDNRSRSRVEQAFSI